MIFSSDFRYSPIALALAFIAAACGGAKEDVPGGPNASSSGGNTPPSSSTNTPGAPSCDAAAARDVAVASEDQNGYPPYAVAECSLVYVSNAGELILRDLATSAEVKLAPTAEKPRRPSIAIDIEGGARRSVITWETTLSAGPSVRVRYGDKVTTIPGDFIMATEPRASEHFVAFTAWKGGDEADDTDVWLYDARTEKARLVLGGPGQQRFADVSGTHVVATDFSEDPDGYYNRQNDLADLVTFEIGSEKVTHRVVPGKQAFPMLGKDGALAYLDWNGVHPQPKLEAYNLKAGSLFADPSTDRLVASVQYASTNPQRPAVSGDTIEWIANPDGKTVLWRAPTNGATAPVRVEGLDGLFLFAPAPRPAMGDRSGFTVLATIDLAKREPAPRLRSVSH